MRWIILIIFSVLFSTDILSQTRLIHVFVALCDNEHQGIVPVPASIGDGTKPHTNLYWGAGYGVRTFFDKKTDDWKLIADLKSKNPVVLDRILFKHKTEDIYLLADAYEGEYIKKCIEDFLLSSNGQIPDTVSYKDKNLIFGGGADLISYIGHNGLMDFNVNMSYKSNKCKKDVIILGCYSKAYFTEDIQRANANPVLWTTHLMAPEAYTLHSAIEGWINNETGKQIDERAAQTYNAYQKCGIKGARNLFTTGF
jgi:hypothetical protein